jgi:transposase-like protein
MSSKRYPEEFKIEAVKQVTEKGHSVAEVAARAGIGVNTVSNLEAGRNVSFENLIRVAMVLGRLQELEELFKPHLNSVDDILRYESNTARQRIKRK